MPFAQISVRPLLAIVTTVVMLCIAFALSLPAHAQNTGVRQVIENPLAAPLTVGVSATPVALAPGQLDPINLKFLGASSSLYVCTKGGTGTKASGTGNGTTSAGSKTGTVSAATTVLSTSCVLPPQDSLMLTTESDLPNLITALGNDASFINLSVPLNMVAGQSYEVAVSMKNSGNTTWQPGTWKLGSQAPQDNTIWGPNRMALT